MPFYQLKKKRKKRKNLHCCSLLVRHEYCKHSHEILYLNLDLVPYYL